MPAYWPKFYLFCGQLVDAHGKIERPDWPSFDSLDQARAWGSWHFINVVGLLPEVN